MTSAPKRLNLALQGGGSHGAFTWGALDRLLQEEGLDIDGISGTSAGAMNGALVTIGYETGGRSGAQAALERFWLEIADRARFAPLQRTLFDRMLGFPWSLDHAPAYQGLEAATHLFSPYQTNPLDLNPLRPVLESLIPERALAACTRIRLFVSATNVRNGKIRVFEGKELGIPALMASACLPQMFQAVQIDGEAYWDGGFMGNPALFPLIYGCESPDILIFQVNPVARPDIPRTAAEIADRLNEISFNSTLMREMRAIAFVQKMVDAGAVDRAAYKRMFIHRIADEAAMSELGHASKLNAELDFLLHLKGLGQAAADRWIRSHWGDIGERDTLDIHDVFL